MGRIQLTANIFKKKTAKLTKTGLRLNAKYKLERMGRLLDRGTRDGYRAEGQGEG